MRSSLAATLGRPEWWAMALAAFLVRGGIVVVVLPLVSLPTVAQLSTLLAPAVETVVLGGQTLAGAMIGGLGLAAAIIALGLCGLAGAWFDLALARDAAGDEDLELPASRVSISAGEAFRIRLLAHVPTVLALAYATFRLVPLAYDELTSPGDATVSVVTRVFERAPDAVAVVVLAWLAGETVGALAVRRAAAGAAIGRALIQSVRQLVRPRGLATLVVTSAVLVGIGLPFLLALGRAWEHVRTYVLEQVDVVPLTAALVLLVGTWILGLSVLGAGLAWRASAWTVEATRD
jgi:GNAT superfamily N-acetyltransferase